MDERRSYPRMNINREAEFTIENRLNPIPCVVEDISASGVRLALSKNLLPEVFSNINLSIGDIFSFNVGAHVAWHDESGGRNTYGLCFNRIDDVDRNRISRYIQDSSFKDLRDQWWKGL